MCWQMTPKKTHGDFGGAEHRAATPTAGPRGHRVTAHGGTGCVSRCLLAVPCVVVREGGLSVLGVSLPAPSRSRL